VREFVGTIEINTTSVGTLDFFNITVVEHTLITPTYRIFLEKMTVAQLLKK
jgi:hypothetical protein